MFTAVIQLGTMVAVVIYFWRDLMRITTTWLSSLRRPELRGELDARMGWYVIIATIPIGVVGLAFNDQIETGARNLYLIGAVLIAAGLVLAVADRVGRRVRDLGDVRRRDAVWVGIAQALALIPGTSRSGATITAGLFLGLQREAAARFSFLLSIPAIVLSGLYGLTELITGDDSVSFGALALATVVAFVFGYVSIAFLLRYLANHSDDDLRGLPGGARRDRPGARGRRARSADGRSTTSNSPVRSTSSSTRCTASEGRESAKPRPASSHALAGLEQGDRSPEPSMKPTVPEVEDHGRLARPGRAASERAARRPGRAALGDEHDDRAGALLRVGTEVGGALPARFAAVRHPGRRGLVCPRRGSGNCWRSFLPPARRAPDTWPRS